MWLCWLFSYCLAVVMVSKLHRMKFWSPLVLLVVCYSFIWWLTEAICYFLRHSQNCEKWLLPASCLSAVCLSSHRHGTTPLPLDGFSWNFISCIFFKSVKKFKFHKNLTIMAGANVLLWSCLTRFFLEWEMFQTKVVEKINTHFVFNNFPPPHPPKNNALFVR